MGFQILIVKALVAFYTTTLGSGRTIDAKVCMHDIPHIVIIQINPPITGCRGDGNHIRNEITGKAKRLTDFLNVIISKRKKP